MTIDSGSGLAPSAFLILLAISDRPRHGLGIMDDVTQRTGGSVSLGPGTLYGTLKRLAARGLVSELDTPPDPSDDDPRRRYYELTAAGRRAVEAEARHLRKLVHVAVGKRVLAGS